VPKTEESQRATGDSTPLPGTHSDQASLTVTVIGGPRWTFAAGGVSRVIMLVIFYFHVSRLPGQSTCLYILRSHSPLRNMYEKGRPGRIEAV